VVGASRQRLLGVQAIGKGARPKAVLPTTCMVMSPRAAWMSIGAPAAAAAPRRAISAALASFISAAYARRLSRPQTPFRPVDKLGRMHCR